MGFGFFDEEVTVEEKRLMVIALNERDGSEEPAKRIVPFTDPETKGLHDFVTKSTRKFFTILKLRAEFLDHDPSEWLNDDTYGESLKIVQSVKVVNDAAERGVALIQEFNSSITRSEEQKQFLLQVIENHRREFVSPTKAGAVKRTRLQ